MADKRACVRGSQSVSESEKHESYHGRVWVCESLSAAEEVQAWRWWNHTAAECSCNDVFTARQICARVRPRVSVNAHDFE